MFYDLYSTFVDFYRRAYEIGGWEVDFSGPRRGNENIIKSMVIIAVGHALIFWQDGPSPRRGRIISQPLPCT